jgi:hypothetical protein
MRRINIDARQNLDNTCQPKPMTTPFAVLGRQVMCFWTISRSTNHQIPAGGTKPEARKIFMTETYFKIGLKNVVVGFSINLIC